MGGNILTSDGLIRLGMEMRETTKDSMYAVKLILNAQNKQRVLRSLAADEKALPQSARTFCHG